MMADGGDCAPVTPRAVEIEIGDEPGRWADLGLAVDGAACTVGGVRLVFADGAPGIHHVVLSGLREERPDGLPLLAARGVRVAVVNRPCGPLGAVAVDHVVALTDSLERTTGALAAAGLPLRRVQPPHAFLPAGTVLLEVVETGAEPALWGLTLSVADLEAAAARLGDRLGPLRDAVQPGRRIATVRPEAGLSVALALMTPRRPAQP
jgi:hypothetical protein